MSADRLAFDTALLGLADAPERAAELAEIGFDGAFTFEGPHDVFAPLILAAGAANLHLMTNVAIAFPRNPIHLAHQAYDLQLLSQGRFALGLGTQIRPQIEKRFGTSFDRPVARMREMIEAIRTIFATWEHGERLNFHGEFYRHTLMTPIFNPGPHPYGLPPLYVGALGPQMTKMVAEAADGLLVMPFNSYRHFHERTLPMIDEGLRRGGRTRDDLAIVAEVIICAGRNEQEMEAADNGTRFLLSFYGSTPSYRPVLAAEGWEDLQPELNAMTKQGRWGEMPALIDERILSTIAVRGKPTEVAKQILDRFGDEADRIALYTAYDIGNETLGEILDELRSLQKQHELNEHA